MARIRELAALKIQSKWVYASGSAALGMASAVGPAGVWWLIIDNTIRTPGKHSGDEGAAMFICFPVALLCWLAFAIPACVLGVKAARSTRDRAARGVAILGSVWTAGGLAVAFGTCIVPGMIAHSSVEPVRATLACCGSRN